MNLEEIKKILPQRYPFLFIDSVLEFEKDKTLVAIKNVTANEPFFAGHFPKKPVMPGVLLIEAMGQAGIIFMSLSQSTDSSETDLYFLCSVKARFKKPVGPGDRVLIEVTPVKITSNSGIIKTIAKVEGEEVARAELTGAKRM